MNDEIKEIKENIKPTLEWLKECAEYNWIFETSNSSELFNYITNLQSENRFLRSHQKLDETFFKDDDIKVVDKDFYIKSQMKSDVIKYITNLEQKVDQYENPDDYTLFYMWLDAKAKDKMKQLQEENEIKTTKLNAIRKYLLNNKLYTFKYDDEELFEITTDKKAKDDLLNILNGGDVEC